MAQDKFYMAVEKQSYNPNRGYRTFINLDDLKCINANTLGFIKIPKIDFKYPIMNTDFYKNHDLY